MRGKIDLGQHKLANLYRAPARKSRGYYKRSRMEKLPGGKKAIYRALWFMVDGAVRDAFANHPEYLTAAGRQSATRSITKRVTGALMGYATQVARGRSMQAVDAPADAAAVKTDGGTTRRSRWMRLFKAFASWVSRCLTRTRGGAFVCASPKIHGGEDG